MMTRGFLLLGAVVLGASACGGGGGSGDQGSASAQQPAAASDGPAKSIARIEPCSLLTKDEIQQQVELAQQPDQLAALKSKGAVWSITMESVPRGVSRTCQVHWQAAVNGEVRRKDDFTVVVTFAGWLTGSVAGMKTPLPIPNLGEEAYFVGGKSGPPYARVRDVAIGIENFPDTKQSKSGVDLLRLAVARVH